jgi:hypothetical protein
MNSPTFSLDEIRVASPCRASWERMKGKGRVRHCGQCDKNVYNLSGMTRAEAEALVRRMEGRLCVRFYRRSDGTMMTEDCPVGLAALRRPVHIVGILMAAFGLAALGFSATGALVLPRLRDGGAQFPAPIQAVLDWILPPTPCVMGAPPPPPVMPLPPPGPQEAPIDD